VVPPKAAGTLLPEDLYRRAIMLGRSAAGISGPNPPVGCLVVRDGAVVGEGATTAVGGPHAEVVALRAAGARALGATVVVTLEPCAHQGRTGPCVDALIGSRVAAVHLVLPDPDPAAAGGMARLRAAGIEVLELSDRLPELAATVAHDLRGFVARVSSGRPHVTLKLAQGADGRTAPGAGGYLTGLAARTRVHRLRSDVDAVLVGSATVRADDPLLDVRHVETARSPRPVVLATDADIDPAARVIGRGALVLVGPRAPVERCARLERAGATVVAVPEARSGRAGLDLLAALAALLDHRILTVLAEPGPVLADALLAEGLVDEVELHVAGVTTPTDADVVPALARLASLIEGWRRGDEHVDVVSSGEDAVLRVAWSDLARPLTSAAEVV
jgi:diaminohydroxyphosphoribosylaminopyrimidine deaminase/5-amino-6-(5-phosphoribosylamino)uracil reductase